MKVQRLLIIGSVLEYIGGIGVFVAVVYGGFSVSAPGADDASAITLRIVSILLACVCATAYFCWIMVKWFVWANSKTTNTSYLYTSATSNGLYLPNDHFLMHFASLADRQILTTIRARIQESTESSELDLETSVPIVYRSSSLIPIVFRLIWFGLVVELLYLTLRDGLIVVAMLCAAFGLYLLFRIAKLSGTPSQKFVLDLDGIQCDSVRYSWKTVSNLRTDIVQLTNRYFFCFDVEGDSIRVNTLVMNADAEVILAQATMLMNHWKHTHA